MSSDHVLLNTLCRFEAVYDIKLIRFLITDIAEPLIYMSAKDAITAVGNYVNFPGSAVNIHVNSTTQG